MSSVAKVAFVDYEHSVAEALDLIGAAGEPPARGPRGLGPPGGLPDDRLIIIKPNLTCANGLLGDMDNIEILPA